jgi:hypothetical protein
VRAVETGSDSLESKVTGDDIVLTLKYKEKSYRLTIRQEAGMEEAGMGAGMGGRNGTLIDWR